MAFSVSNFNFMKIGAFVLLLVDLGIAYPVYLKVIADPLEEIKLDEPRGRGHLIPTKTDEDTGEIKTGFPPSKLLTWDPFKVFKPKTAIDVETSVEDAPLVKLPIPTDNIKILGIISLNGEYMALMSTPDNPAAEVRRGQILSGTEGVRAEKITAKGILLTQPGAENTFLPLSQPELNAEPWYHGDFDTSQIRGGIEIKRQRRR